MKTTKILLSFCSSVVLTGSALASIVQYGVTYTDGYFQVNDGPPDQYASYLFSDIASDVDNDFIAGSITMPGNLGESYAYSSERYSFWYSSFYPNQAMLEAAYPSGTALFSISLGNEAPATASLFIPATDFVNETPYFTGGTFSSLQNTPAGVPATVQWDSTTHNGGAAPPTSSLLLTDLTGVSQPYYNQGDGATYTSDTLPGSVLVSGHTYRFTLQFNTDYSTANAGFTSATGYVGFNRYANGDFHVAANPGTVSGQCILDDYYLPTLTPIEVQVIGPLGVEDSQTIPLGFDYWYAFDTASIGEKTVTFRANHFLTKAVSNVDLGVGQDAITINLINGDADNDNEIGPGDFALVSGAFGAVPGDGNWDPNADVDNDSEVGPSDFSVISTNFGLSGD